MPLLPPHYLHYSCERPPSELVPAEAAAVAEVAAVDLVVALLFPVSNSYLIQPRHSHSFLLAPRSFQVHVHGEPQLLLLQFLLGLPRSWQHIAPLDSLASAEDAPPPLRLLPVEQRMHLECTHLSIADVVAVVQQIY